MFRHVVFLSHFLAFVLCVGAMIIAYQLGSLPLLSVVALLTLFNLGGMAIVHGIEKVAKKHGIDEAVDKIVEDIRHKND